MCKIFGVRTFHCLFKQRKLSTWVFARILLTLNIFNIYLVLWPYIANHSRWKSFVVFVDQLVNTNFSSELVIILLYNTYTRLPCNHECFPVNYSSFLQSWNFFTLNDLQYMVVVFTFPHCCYPHSLLLVIYSDTTKLVSHGQTLNAEHLSTNPEWLYTVYNQ